MVGLHGGRRRRLRWQVLICQGFLDPEGVAERYNLWQVELAFVFFAAAAEVFWYIRVRVTYFKIGPDTVSKVDIYVSLSIIDIRDLLELAQRRIGERG